MATITGLDSIDSIGYAGSDGTGTIAANDAWGVMSSLTSGSRYFVYSQTQMLPSIRTDGKVGLDFSTGICGGWGVWDYLNKSSTEGSNKHFQVEFDTVTSDTWFLVTLHRKWGAYGVEGNQQSSIQVINAGSTGGLPAVGSGTPALTAVDFFNVVDWSDDDQPLAMAKVSVDGQGNNTVTSLRDLRVVGCGGGVQLIYDRLAMQYLGAQGTNLLLWENGHWVSLIPVRDSSGAFSWIEDAGPFAARDLSSLSASSFGGSGSGWSTVGATGPLAGPSGGKLTTRIFTDGNRVIMDLATRRSGGTISTTSTGNFTGGDALVFTISNSKYWPDAGTKVKVSGTYLDSGGATHTCWVYITDNGQCWLDDGQPNTNIGRQTGNTYSITLHAEWTKVK